VSCPSNPAAPQGYVVWKGPVPTPLQQWAAQLIKTVNRYPYGQTWQNTDPSGNIVLARKDHHTWHIQPDGTVLTNICWPGITIYRPIPVAAQAGDSSLVTNIETATPSPQFAVYDSPPQSTDWTLVAVTAGTIVALGAAFWLAIRFAGPKTTALQKRRA
jgi:hypothetical protein